MKRGLLLLLAASLARAQDSDKADYSATRKLNSDGRRAEAIEAAKAIIARSPSFFRAYSLIALAEVQEGHPERARQYFRERAAADGTNAWPWYGLGSVEAGQRNRAAQLPLYRECVKRQPEAWPCYERLGMTSTTEAELAASLPKGADPICVLLARAEYFTSKRQFDRARRLADEGMRELKEQNRSDLTAAFHELSARIYGGTNLDPERGLPDWNAALEIWSRLGDSEREQTAMTSMVDLLRQAQKYDEAEKRLDGFEAELSARAGRTDEAAWLSLRSDLRLARGDITGAIDLLIRQTKILEAVGLDVGNYWRRVGGLYARTGDFDTAMNYLSRARDAAQRDSDKAFILQSMGVVEWDRGNYAEALQKSEHSLALFQEAKMPWQAGAQMRNIAEIRTGLGDFERAEQLLLRSLASAHRQIDSAEVEGAESDLGNLYTRMGRNTDALVHLKRAEQLAPHTSYTSAHLDTLLSIASVYRQMGQPLEAVRYALRGLVMAKAAGASAPQSQALTELAAAELRAGKTTAALTDFQQALDLADQAGLSELAIAARRGLAQVLIRSGRAAEGIAHLETAVNRLEQLRAATPGPDLRASFLSENWRLYEETVAALTGIHEDRKAFDYAERGRARSFLDVLGRSGAARPVELSVIERRLGAGSNVILAYLMGEKESWLWAISGQGTRMFRLPRKALLAGMIQQFRESGGVRPRAAAQDYRAAARSLYAVLCAPAEEMLKGAGRVLIVPDGGMFYLPFEALIDGGGHYLVERAAVAYAPSVSAFELGETQRRDRSHDTRLEVAGFGAPELPERAGESGGESMRGVYERAGFRFPPLPHAREELSQIASLFPAGTVRMLMGAEASASAVRSTGLVNYKRIHFATHTVFDERSPDQTGIVLTPRGGDDGILRARDILRLRLDADLVVLSACQSGIGKVVRGEGVAGLSQAFLYVGAARVVVSSWEVNDLATAELMTRFYRGMSKGVVPAEALRQAKLGMIRSGAPAYRHPYYWASFVMVGSF